jgi:hypothetical protein
MGPGKRPTATHLRVAPGAISLTRCISRTGSPAFHQKTPRTQLYDITLTCHGITEDFEHWFYSKLAKVAFCDQYCCSRYIETKTRLGPLRWTLTLAFFVDPTGTFEAQVIGEKTPKQLMVRFEREGITLPVWCENGGWSATSRKCRRRQGWIWSVILMRLE